MQNINYKIKIIELNWIISTVIPNQIYFSMLWRKKNSAIYLYFFNSKY